jgi:toxin ParE1/3/4
MAKRPPPLGPKRLVLSTAARRDLHGITDYIANEAGETVAERFADKLDAALVNLAALGHSGASREWISPRLRLHVFGNHCIYFRVTPTETRIVRVLNGAQDLNAIIFEAE